MFQLKISPVILNFFWLKDRCFECGAAMEARSVPVEIQAKFGAGALL